MQIKTSNGGGVVATIEGTVEDARKVAMRLWKHADDEGVHMDGLEIWDDEPDSPTKMLVINHFGTLTCCDYIER